MFHDRADAGKKLAERLKEKIAGEGLVFALPRGGVVVAKEVADALRLPLDVLVVRKIGAPGNEEFAIGAVGEDGEPIINDELVGTSDITPTYLDRSIEKERKEVVRRVKAYRSGEPADVKGKTAIIVDDGIATGMTVEAAIETLRKRGAARIVVAAPVGAKDSIETLRNSADEVIVLHIPDQFFAVGQFYQNFPQVTDDDVRRALVKAQQN
jgi:putative phosphoribosyl transferase